MDLYLYDLWRGEVHLGYEQRLFGHTLSHARMIIEKAIFSQNCNLLWSIDPWSLGGTTGGDRLYTINLHDTIWPPTNYALRGDDPQPRGVTKDR